jgi:hypothetical protein
VSPEPHRGRVLRVELHKCGFTVETHRPPPPRAEAPSGDEHHLPPAHASERDSFTCSAGTPPTPPPTSHERQPHQGLLPFARTA